MGLGFRGFNVSEFQGFRVTGLQGYRVSGFQGFRAFGRFRRCPELFEGVSGFKGFNENSATAEGPETP